MSSFLKKKLKICVFKYILARYIRFFPVAAGSVVGLWRLLIASIVLHLRLCVYIYIDR